MSLNIFHNNAAKYWEKDLPVMPLKIQDKKPVLGQWSILSDNMPTESEKAHWLKEYAHGNIGLPLGKQSGLCAIDVDTDDRNIQEAIMSVLKPFPSPWARVGKKGFVLMYKQPKNDEILRNFSIKDMTTKGLIMDFLSGGRQVVLPPSVHPETKRPYTSNCELVDVLDQIPHLPMDIEEQIRSALEAIGIKLSASGMGNLAEFVSVGNRDNKMTAAAGFYAHMVTKGEMNFLDAVRSLHGWFETQVEKVAGDQIDIDKGIKSLCNFLVRDVMVGKRIMPPGWDEGMTPEQKVQYGLVFTEEQEEWTLEQVLTYLQAKHEQHGSQSSGWMEAVDHVLERLSKSVKLTSLHHEMIMRYISDAGGSKITMSSLRKRVKEITAGDVMGTDHTEIAKLVIDELDQYGEIRFYNSQFWQWCGSHWEVLPNEKILQTIQNGFGSLQAAKRYSDHTGIMKTMQSQRAKALRTLDVPGVNFANGYLTHELKLAQHDKEHGCTYTLPYRYLPELADQCPMFHKFLNRCFIGDEDIEDKKKAIQEALAVTLFGVGTKFARAILLFGPGNSGKSELLKIVDSLVPDIVKAALSPDKWQDKFGPAQLADKLLNLAGELSENKRIDGQNFKTIVSGEPITGQFKNQQLFVFHPKAVHWFGSNHMPKSDDPTNGFLRRWLLLRFEHPITKEEKVINIAGKIVAAQREAIVAWAVQSMPRMIAQQEYTLPASHNYWISQIANGNDSVRLFLTESGLVRIAPPSAPEDSVSETKLYEIYSTWCLLSVGAAQRAGSQRFRARLFDLTSELGFKVVRQTYPSGGFETLLSGITPVNAKKAA